MDIAEKELLLMSWYRVSDYQPEMYEKALAWTEGWAEPCPVTWQTASTTDGRGNDVAQHTGWLMNTVGAFYEDFGYFSESELKYYGIDAVEYIFPLKEIDLPDITTPPSPS